VGWLPNGAGTGVVRYGAKDQPETHYD